MYDGYTIAVEHRIDTDLPLILDEDPSDVAESYWIEEHVLRRYDVVLHRAPSAYAMRSFLANRWPDLSWVMSDDADWSSFEEHAEDLTRWRGQQSETLTLGITAYDRRAQPVPI